MKIHWKSITKTVVHQVVVLGVARTTSVALDGYTGVDTSRFTVNLGTLVIGELVADAVKPMTDKLVDKSFEMAAKQIKSEGTAEKA